MPVNPYSVAVDFSKTEVGNLVSSLTDGFKYLLPIGLLVIAFVMTAFWLLRRAKRFASSAN